MNIAFAVDTDNGIFSEVSRRFGRASGFIVVDQCSGQTAYYDNKQNLAAVQGAGIQSAQNVIDSGATAVVAVHCGPKAFKVLQTAEIEVYLVKEETIGSALNKLSQGKLKCVKNADVEEHWL